MTTWVERTAADWPLGSFRWTFVFGADGVTLTSESTLRFRTRQEVEGDLHDTGYVLVEVRDAPDRLGAELVLIARRLG